jgi:hypothetical protein
MRCNEFTQGRSDRGVIELYGGRIFDRAYLPQSYSPIDQVEVSII